MQRDFGSFRYAQTLELYERLPRNSAYKYEYVDNETWISPRPIFCHAMLDLASAPDPECAFPIRSLPLGGIPDLASLFMAAFHSVQPFASLSAPEAQRAVKECLAKTHRGGDGPLIEQACFCAEDLSSGRSVGAILITLLPPCDEDDWERVEWTEPPPATAVEQRLGQPHVTWVLVSHSEARQGVGTALLGASVRALQHLGYERLASTFLMGNDRSTLWHWRNGFRLLSGWSNRVRRRREPK
jgi:hypothetical protein